ncbi:hypothetical protein K0M31_010073 [Melipona bicolor]|uniref:Uncharacterized protein n=1 Tax=Melipona bicolor TaxID=60889 RepID=A0AA40FMV4_9HYME|nr:hypothetical protein K0M31_010073 [Melipona bicolor]
MHSSEHLAKPKRKTPVQRHTGSTSFETIRDYLILRIDCTVRVSPEGSHVKLPRGDVICSVMAIGSENAERQKDLRTEGLPFTFRSMITECRVCQLCSLE